MDQSNGSDRRPAANWVPRQRDRRDGLGTLLPVLSRGVGRRSDVALLRGAFEEMLRRAIPARAVHIRESSSRWSGVREAERTPESVAFEVPGADGGAAAVLEATFDPGCHLG